jgi:polar amino acid transport system substrate-binding protein
VSALTMRQAGPGQEPKTAIGRVVAVGWMAASVIVIAVFTAGITSQLTARQLRGIVHEVDDLKTSASARSAAPHRRTT